MLSLYTAGMGQRVHVGKVNMDHEQTAVSTHHSVEETRQYATIFIHTTNCITAL